MEKRSGSCLEPPQNPRRQGERNLAANLVRFPQSLILYLLVSIAAWFASASPGLIRYGATPVARAETTQSSEGQIPTEPPLSGGSSIDLTPKQKQALRKSTYEKLKKDASDLAGLAKSLQEDIDASNQDVLSLKVVDKADKIEKLARRIKMSAKGD